MNRQDQPEVAGQGVGENPLFRHVLECLRVPHTLDELRLDLGVSRRDVEAAVEALRVDGHPIVGGNDGLHLTSDPVELEQYVAARRRRVVSIYLGTRALRLTARRLRERVDLTLFGSLEDAA